MRLKAEVQLQKCPVFWTSTWHNLAVSSQCSQAPAVSPVTHFPPLCLHDGQRWSVARDSAGPAFIVWIITREDSDKMCYTHGACVSLSRDNRLQLAGQRRLDRCGLTGLSPEHVSCHLAHQARGVLPGIVTTQMSWEHSAPVVTAADHSSPHHCSAAQTRHLSPGAEEEDKNLTHVSTTRETRLLMRGSECSQRSKVMMITGLISPNELS